jgi:hypothetical protein
LARRDQRHRLQLRWRRRLLSNGAAHTRIVGGAAAAEA